MSTSKKEGELWGAEADDWANLQEPMSNPLWIAMLDAMCVGHGTQILDVGCGAGGAAQLSWARGARIDGVDVAASSIAIAKKRIPEATFQVGDMEALPFDDGAFDAVMSANCIQFVPDASKGVSELARVCKPGSKVCIAVFGAPDTVDENFVFNALADLMHLPTDLMPLPKPKFKEYRFSAPNEVEDLMHSAGLKDLQTETINTPFFYEDREIGYRAQRSAGSLQEVIDAVGEQPVKEAIFREFKRFTKSDGTIQMNNEMIYVTGTR